MSKLKLWCDSCNSPLREMEDEPVLVETDKTESEGIYDINLSDYGCKCDYTGIEETDKGKWKWRVEFIKE